MAVGVRSCQETLCGLQLADFCRIDDAQRSDAAARPRRGGGTRYQMRQKLVSIGQDFWIENDQGQKVPVQRCSVCDDGPQQAARKDAPDHRGGLRGAVRESSGPFCFLPARGPSPAPISILNSLRRRPRTSGILEGIGDRIVHIPDELHRRLEIGIAFSRLSVGSGAIAATAGTARC